MKNFFTNLFLAVFLNSLIAGASYTNNGMVKVSNSKQVELGGNIDESETGVATDIDPLDILALKFN